MKTAAAAKEGQRLFTAPAAVDIGGTLAKVVYWRPPNPPRLPDYVKKEAAAFLANIVRCTGSSSPSSASPSSCSLSSSLAPDRSLNVTVGPDGGGALKFIKFPTTHVEAFMTFLRSTRIHEQYGPNAWCGASRSLNATGGGAYKFAERVRTQLNLNFNQQDEMRSLVRGLNFLLSHHEEEVFTVAGDPRDLSSPVERCFVKSVLRFPFIVVNVGSGVSILKVTSAESFERVSGSGIGGGTFWGLTKLLTSVTSFDDVIECCKPGVGDSSRVDLLVGDIYGDGITCGTSLKAAGLDRSVTASYLGKVQRMVRGEKPRDADVVKSLVTMVADNVGQLGYLNAQIHSASSVLFCGGFLVDNPCVWKAITQAVRYWSKGQMPAMFLQHDGYLGALGALLSTITQ